MSRRNPLAVALGRVFHAPAIKRPDTQRRQREEAKKLAAAHGIEIEKFPEGGMNVWPPKGLDDALDPFEGDHYADNWTAALAMVKQYAEQNAARP